MRARSCTGCSEHWRVTARRALLVLIVIPRMRRQWAATVQRVGIDIARLR